MKIIVYATHSFGTFETLKQHPDIIVLGYGTKWQGFIERTRVVLEYLSTLPDDEVVVIIDGFDSYIKKTEGLLEEFQNMDCKILFSLNNSGLPKIIHKYIEKKINPTTCKDNLVINAGLMMGYVAYLKLVWQTMLGPSNDDQRNLNIACKDFSFFKIDTNHIIFENCSNLNEVNTSQAYFCQIPASISFSRSIRAIQEYYEYFIPEIVSISGLIIAILYYYNRKKIRKLNKRYYK